LKNIKKAETETKINKRKSSEILEDTRIFFKSVSKNIFLAFKNLD